MSGREPIGRFHDDACTYQPDWFTGPCELVLYAIPDDGTVVLMKALVWRTSSTRWMPRSR